MRCNWKSGNRAERGRVAGATYHSRYADARAWPRIGRGIQVLRYVHVHRLTRWLAIDDQNDGFEGHEQHFAKCNEQSALSDFETVEVLRRRLAEQFGEQSGAS
ncbi:HAD domain-containing protein [Paraburkholderia sp. Clong3]|uniref:HAD domain-containing protein n=1 Tax=Paraburkholderia sp. Clong3 TaxID=2991061 RepID=UPI003D1E2DFA